jgi:hypothetical protein
VHRGGYGTPGAQQASVMNARGVKLIMRAACAWVAVLLVANILSACGAVSSNPPASSTPMNSPTYDAAAQPAIDAALSAAAGHLSLPQTDVRLEQVEPREWPDASLGCPGQGAMYAQVVTPGYLIMISGGGKRLEYHSDQRGRVVLCRES